VFLAFRWSPTARSIRSVVFPPAFLSFFCFHFFLLKSAGLWFPFAPGRLGKFRTDFCSLELFVLTVVSPKSFLFFPPLPHSRFQALRQRFRFWALLTSPPQKHGLSPGFPFFTLPGLRKHRFFLSALAPPSVPPFSFFEDAHFPLRSEDTVVSVGRKPDFQGCRLPPPSCFYVFFFPRSLIGFFFPPKCHQCPFFHGLLGCFSLPPPLIFPPTHLFFFNPFFVGGGLEAGLNSPLFFFLHGAPTTWTSLPIVYQRPRVFSLDFHCVLLTSPPTLSLYVNGRLLFSTLRTPFPTGGNFTNILRGGVLFCFLLLWVFRVVTQKFFLCG